MRERFPASSVNSVTAVTKFFDPLCAGTQRVSGGNELAGGATAPTPALPASFATAAAPSFEAPGSSHAYSIPFGVARPTNK